MPEAIVDHHLPRAAARRPSRASACGSGTGTFSVNGRPIEEYFVRETLQLMIREVLETANAIGRFEITANVNGGGPEGQAGARPPRRRARAREVRPERCART